MKIFDKFLFFIADLYTNSYVSIKFIILYEFIVKQMRTDVGSSTSHCILPSKKDVNIYETKKY